VLGRLAPHLIHPKPIYFTLAKSDPRSPVSLFFGVWLYYLIQFFQGQLFSPPKMFLTPRSIAKRLPELEAGKVKAVFTFWDSETDDVRLVLETLKSAAAMGSHALNYVELIDYDQKNDSVAITLLNREANERLRIQAKRLINCSGPFVDEVRQRGGKKEAPLVDRIAGTHIDVYPPVAGKSYYVSAKDGRLVFLLRREEDGLVYTRIGTTERPLAENEPSDNPHATQTEITYLKNLVAEFFPKAELTEETIVKTDAGIRPLQAQSVIDPFQKSREHALIEEGRVLHVVGVKLTDFRRVAKEVADRLKIPRGPQPLIRSAESALLYPETTMKDVIDRTMALHWDDYVKRRRGLRPFVDAKKNPERLKKGFEEFAGVFGWDEARRRMELERI
jgi:glycerol-3-phosphate dehydrogenase